jgi:Leucine-rich repeat (LRR) protein
MSLFNHSTSKTVNSSMPMESPVQYNENITISSIPSEVVSLAIGFYGNPDKAGSVCKSWQKNRADAFYEILDGNKKDPRISQVISTFMPRDGSTPQWVNIAENTRQELINQARIFGIQVRDLRGVSLPWFLDQIELEKDAHLLRCFDRIIDQIPEGTPLPLLEGTTTAKATTARTWMTANQEILATIQELDLSNTGLHVLPPEITQLIGLQKLDLRNNRLTSLPATFGQLVHLQRLNLHNNRLTSLPETFGQLTSLELLSLRNNHLISLPTTFTQLTNLQMLSLSDNQFASLPETFGQLTNLQVLTLSNNPQLISLPSTFHRLTNLRALDCHHQLKIQLYTQLALPYVQSILSRLSNRVFYFLNPSSLFQGIDFRFWFLRGD